MALEAGALARSVNLEDQTRIKMLSQAAAGADITERVYADGRGAGDLGGTLVRAAVIFNAAIVHNASTYATVTLEQYDATGTHVATVGTHSTNLADVVAGVAVDLGITADGVALSPGDVLAYKLHQVSTGVAVPTGLLVIATIPTGDEG